MAKKDYSGGEEALRREIEEARAWNAKKRGDTRDRQSEAES